MKKLLFISIAAALIAFTGHAQTAAEWAEKNADALKAIDAAALVKQGQPAYDGLFAQIKTGGASDAIASVTIGAVSEYVMTKDAPAAARKVYAAALLAAAQNAKEPDVTCFFLNQLRWCGMPDQAKAIAAFTKSTEPSVAELASITVYAVTDDRAAKLKPGAPSACRAFNQEVAKLSPAARSKRLMEAFDGADDGVAGAALAWLNEKGNAEKTADWTAKLATAKSPTRRVMLLDALALRGDKSACEAIASCTGDADTLVVKAALSALITLDPAFFAARFVEKLKAIEGNQVNLWRDAARQVATATLIKPLLAACASFNTEGQKLALDLFRDRRTVDATALAIAASESGDEGMANAGYRILRETGTTKEAETILKRLLKTNGRGEATGALAAIAKRDTSGKCADMLRKALADAPEQDRWAFYDTAARIGGDLLLADAEKSGLGADANLAAAAIRALAAWADTSSVPALMRLALTAPEAKNQTLAKNGVTQKLTGKNVDKAALHEQWKKIRETEGNGENKTAIDELFK